MKPIDEETDLNVLRDRLKKCTAAWAEMKAIADKAMAQTEDAIEKFRELYSMLEEKK